MKLTKQIKGSDRRPKGDVLLGREHGSGVQYVTPDGEVAEGLDGEPPQATSHGWGDLSWLRRWRF